MGLQIGKKWLFTSMFCCASLLVFAQTEALSRTEAKAFEGALSFAQSITGWALLIVAGSIVTLVGTSYYRPMAPWARFPYLLFIPGWLFLARSMWRGVSVQRVYLAYLFTNPTEERIKQLKDAVREDSLSQIREIEIALCLFGVWLFFYLFWWILNKEHPRGERPISDA
jgi:hypothetical protein